MRVLINRIIHQHKVTKNRIWKQEINLTYFMNTKLNRIHKTIGVITPFFVVVINPFEER